MLDGIILSVFQFFFRHSKVRLDATDLAKSFLSEYEHSNVHDQHERYKGVMSSMFLQEFTYADTFETPEALADATFEQAIFESVDAMTPFIFRSVVYYAIILILTTRYKRQLKDSELKVVSEAVVAEIPHNL